MSKNPLHKVVNFLAKASLRYHLPQLKRRYWLSLFIILLLIFITHCSHGRNGHDHDQQAIPVVVASAHQGDMPVYLTGLGTVTPTNSVTVKTQVNGQLLRVLFKEGDTVKAGDLLAEIDPRPYQAQLLEYEGQLERDQALLANALLDLSRYQKLWKQNSVSKQTLDTQLSLVSQDQGTVKMDEGLVANAKVNLIYTQITSPITGLVGLRQVDPGNYVQTSDTNGVVIVNSVNPMTVIFTLPEDQLQAVLRAFKHGKKLPAVAYNRDQSKKLASGTLVAIDNQADPTTGTVKLRAQFANDDNALLANQFVNIQLWVNTLHHVTIIPTPALQHGASNTFVYLLKADHTVSMTPVTVVMTHDDSTAITSGITPGQSVVIAGADKLTDGAAVTLPGETAPSTAATNKKGHHRHKAA